MNTLFRGVVLVLCLLAVPRAWAQTADPTGHWEGTIVIPMGQIDFELDIAREGDVLVATYSQKAQGLRGLPLTGVTLDGRAIRLVLLNGGPGGGVFTGELLTDGTTISGEVKAPAGSVPFNLYRTGPAAMPAAVRNAAVRSALEGTWRGTLDESGREVTLVLSIANRADGTASVLLAQADRPALQFPAQLSDEGATISLEVTITSGAWKGSLTPSGELVGTWSQQGGSLPLTFRK